jgi:splicing factor 3B subunit 1
MQPPIKDLPALLTPILRNREKVQEQNRIDLVGRQDRGAEHVAREWMRVLDLDMPKAHKKAIRRATVNTSLATSRKRSGPSEVLATLLDNLKVQERQNRVCTMRDRDRRKATRLRFSRGS